MNVFDLIREKLKEEKADKKATYERIVNKKMWEMSNVLSGKVAEIDDVMKIVDQVEKECSDEWILCSDKLPDTDEYSVKTYWATARIKNADECTVRLVRWNCNSKQWEWSNCKKMSNDWEIVAWKEYETPKPYNP